jgi:hypothetical protein
VWNDAFVTQFKLHSRHLLGGKKENHENFSEDSRSSGRDLNSNTK